MPQATVQSSLVWEPWFAWHSMQRSMMWLRQIAQLSTTMSHAQSATALHFLISKRFSPGGPGSSDEEAMWFFSRPARAARGEEAEADPMALRERNAARHLRGL